MAAEGSRSGSAADSYIGSLISLTSKSEMRYEGVLYNINTVESSIGLQNVRSFGTEGRKKDGPQVPPSEKVYEYILFRGSDIKDLQVKSSPAAQTSTPVNSDPAIIQSQHTRPAPVSTSLPANVVSAAADTNLQTSQLGLPGSNVQNAAPLYQPGGSVGSWGPSAPSANGGGIGMPMYWPGYYAPPNGLPSHQYQQPLMRPPGLSMPPFLQQQMPPSLQQQVPSSLQQQIPYSLQPQMPAIQQQQMPSSLQTQMPPSLQQQQMPSSLQTQMPPPLQQQQMSSSLQTQMPPSLQTQMPSVQQQQASSTQLQMPSSLQTQMPPSLQQHQMPSSLQTQMPSVQQQPPSVQQQPPSSTQLQMPSSLQQQMPSSTQLQMPSLQQQMPSSFQHPMQYPRYSVPLPLGNSSLPAAPSLFPSRSSAGISTSTSSSPVIPSSLLPASPLLPVTSSTLDAATSSIPIKAPIAAPLPGNKTPVTSLSPASSLLSSGLDGDAILQPLSSKPITTASSPAPQQNASMPHSVPSNVGAANPISTQAPAPALLTPGHLLKSSSISPVPSSQTVHKDVEVVQVSSSTVPEHPPSADSEVKLPTLPLTTPSRPVHKPNGAPTRPFHGYRGRGGRGRGRMNSRPLTTFDEEFDFTAMNEKFKKDEVWGHLGKKSSKSHDQEEDGHIGDEEFSKYEDADMPKIDIKPVYNKDDFFDSLSFDALDQESNHGRHRFSEQRKIDTETFGEFSRYRRGGRGPGRGGRYRGSFYGRGGYGYGRGRGRGGPN